MRSGSGDKAISSNRPVTTFLILSLVFLSLSALAMAVEICPADKLPTELKITHSRITANPVIGEYYNQIDITTKLEWYNPETDERGPLPSRRIAFEISLMRNFSKEICASGGEGCNIFTLIAKSEDAIFFRTTSDDGSTRIIIDLDQVFDQVTEPKFTDPAKISYSITATYDPKEGLMTTEGVENDAPYLGNSDTATYTPSSLPLINIMACFPIILILGLLMAAMQVAGRNPFGYLDFSRVSFRTPGIRRRGVKGITIGTPTIVSKKLIMPAARWAKKKAVAAVGSTIGRAFKTKEGKPTWLGRGVKTGVKLVGIATGVGLAVSAVGWTGRKSGTALAWMGRQMKAVMGKKGAIPSPKGIASKSEDALTGLFALKKGVKGTEVRDNLLVQNIREEVRITQAIRTGTVKTMFGPTWSIGGFGGARLWSLSTQTALLSGVALVERKELAIDEDIKKAVDKGKMSPKAAAGIISDRNEERVKDLKKAENELRKSIENTLYGASNAGIGTKGEVREIMGDIRNLGGSNLIDRARTEIEAKVELAQKKGDEYSAKGDTGKMKEMYGLSSSLASFGSDLGEAGKKVSTNMALIDNANKKIEAYTLIQNAAELNKHWEKLEKSLVEAVSGAKGTSERAELTLDSWVKKNAPIEGALELAVGSGIISKEEHDKMKLSMADESSTSLNTKLRDIVDNALKDKSAPEEKIKAANLMAESLDAYENNATKINAKALNIARSNDVISATEAAEIGKIPLDKQESKIRELASMAFNDGKIEAAKGIESIINTPKTLGDAERMAGEAYHSLPVLFTSGSQVMVKDTAGRIIEHERNERSLESLNKNSDRLKEAESDVVKTWESTREQVKTTLEDKRMTMDEKTKTIENIENKGAEDIGKIISTATNGEININVAKDIGSGLATSVYKDEISFDVIRGRMKDNIGKMQEEIKLDREDLEKAVGNNIADGIIKSLRTESADELNEQLKRVNGYSDTMAAATASAKYYDIVKSNELLEKLRGANALTLAEQKNADLLTEASKGIEVRIKNAREISKEHLPGNEVMRKAFENAEKNENYGGAKPEGKSTAGYSKGLKEKIEGFESTLGGS